MLGGPSNLTATLRAPQRIFSLSSTHAHTHTERHRTPWPTSTHWGPTGDPLRTRASFHLPRSSYSPEQKEPLTMRALNAYLLYLCKLAYKKPHFAYLKNTTLEGPMLSCINCSTSSHRSAVLVSCHQDSNYLLPTLYAIACKHGSKTVQEKNMKANPQSKWWPTILPHLARSNSDFKHA